MRSKMSLLINLMMNLSACFLFLIFGVTWSIFLQLIACALLGKTSVRDAWACATQTKAFFLIFTFVSALVLAYIIFYTPHRFLMAYTLFVSALLINAYTDIQKMVIVRWTSLYLVVLGWFFAYLCLIPLSVQNSMLGAVVGYGVLWIVERFFYVFTRRTGIGRGDFELLALIGAFIGVRGVHMSLLVGSSVGALIGISVLLVRGGNIRELTLPFGPFLALGAATYVLAQIVPFASRLA